MNDPSGKKEHEEKLHKMADALIKYETIDSDQIARIMRGEPPGEPNAWSESSGPPPGSPTAPATADPSSASGPSVGPSPAGTA